MYTPLTQPFHPRIGIDILPEPSQLKSLKLLRGVVKETMRMYHPLGINVRVAKKDTCLPVGGGSDGTQPVAVLKGEQISTFPSTSLP